MQELTVNAGGKLVILDGDVWVRTQEGTKELLLSGTRVEAGDVLLLADGASIELEYEDGGSLHYASSPDLGMVATGVVETITAPGSESSLTSESEQAELQAAILQGVDPTQLFEAAAAGPAPAAGAPAGNEGGGFVEVGRTGDETIAAAGYDTDPTQGGAGQAPRVEDQFIENDNPVTISGLTPAAQGGELSANEAHLPEGSSPDAGALVGSGSFNIQTPDGLDDLVIGGVTVIADGVFLGGTIATPSGTVTIVAFDPASGEVSYQYQLSDNALHDAGSDSVFETLTVLLSDSNGSTASDQLVVQILDDMPSIGLAGEGDVLEQQSISGTWELVAGADGAEVTVLWNGSEFGLGEVIDTGVGLLTVLADGSWTFTATNDLDNSNQVAVAFELLTTDGDGDIARDGHLIRIHDGTDPSGGNQLQLVVDEAEIEDAAQGDLFFTAGSDTLSDFHFMAPENIAIDVSGDLITDLTWVLSEDGQTMTGLINGEAAIILTITWSDIAPGETGHVSVAAQLLDAFPHPEGGGNNEIAVSGIVIGTDVDGDAVSGTVSVTVIDDTPDVTLDGATEVVEGEGVTGSWALDQGADGSTLTVLFGGNSYALGEAIDTGVGTLTVLADGSWYFEAALGLDNSNQIAMEFSVLATDADGDLASDSHLIRIHDGSDPTGGSQLALTVQEAEIEDAAQGDLFFTAGSDALGDFHFMTPESITVDVNGDFIADLTWQLSADGQSMIGLINGEAAIVLAIDWSEIAPGETGNVTVTAQLLDAFPHPDADGNNEITVSGIVIGSDVDGDPVSGTVSVTVVDDVAMAQDDANSVTEDDANNLIDGQVLDNDQAGADQDAVFVDWSDAAAAIQALAPYGTLVLNGDGSYSFELDNNAAAVQALGAGDSLSFDIGYAMADADGDQSTATLTITIHGADDGVTLGGLDGPEQTVLEANLADGSAPDNGALTQSGSFTFTAADGLASINIGGTTLTLAELQDLGNNPVSITTAYGTLVLTGFVGDASGGEIAYGYTLDDNVDNDSQAGASDGSYVDSLAVVVTDDDGSSANASLDITIVDDEPMAQDDANSVTEDDANNLIDGQVLDNDQAGADQDAVFVDWSDAAAAIQALAPYGTLVLNGDGSYSFELDNNAAAVQAMGAGESLSFDIGYAMADADGDQSTATLIITIHGADDGVTLGGLDGSEQTVLEANLADGSAPDNGALTQSGSFTFTAADGLASINIGGTTLTLAELQDLGNNPVSITTAYGTLVLTGFVGDASGGEIAYSYTLDDNVDNDSQAGASDGSYVDSLAVVVTDDDGSSANASLDITIIDDVPTAQDDANSVTEDDANNLIDGQVLDNDQAGADQDAVFVDWNDAAAAIQALAPYGTLVLNGDGSYSFELDNNAAAVQALGAGDSLSFDIGYAMADADGDQSTATLTITIHGADDGVTLGGLDGSEQTVLEANLTDGSAPDNGALTQSGSFTFTAADGLASINIGGTTLTLAELQDLGNNPVSITTAYGTLVLTGFVGDANGGEIAYSYTLDDNVDNDSQAGASDGSYVDSLAVVVTDDDGSSANASLDIEIVDDLPGVTLSGPTMAIEGGATVAGTWSLNEGADGAGTLVWYDGSSYGLGEAIDTGSGILTVLANGTWTFEPGNGAADSIGFTLEATDGDGDIDSASHTINIADGADPLGGDSLSLVVDDADTEGSNTDSDAGTLSFTAGSDDITGFAFGSTAGISVSGLDGSLTWSTDGSGNLIGSLSGSPILVLSLVGSAIAAGASGEVTVTAQLLDNLPHDLSVDSLSISGIEVQALEADGDNASGTVAVTVTDDLPELQVGDTQVDNLVGLYTRNWTVDSGADDFSTDPVNTVDSPAGINVTLLDDLGEGTLTSREDIYDGNGNYQGEMLTVEFQTEQGTETFFTLFMKVDGTYEFNLVTPNPSIPESSDFTDANGGNQAELWAEDILLSKNSSDPVALETDIRFTTTAGSTVNSSVPGIGVDNNFLSSGQTLFVDFFDGNADGNNDGLPDSGDQDDATHPDVAKEIDQASFTFQLKGNNSPDAVIRFTFLDENGDPLLDGNNQPIYVEHLVSDGETVSLDTPDGFSGFYGVQIDNVGVTDVRLLGATTSNEILPDDQSLNFHVDVVDGDGDSAGSDFTITIDEPDNDLAALYEQMSRMSAEDDAGLTVVSLAEPLDLSDLLQGESAGNLDQYLDFAVVGDDTLMAVDAQGDGSGADQGFVYQDVDLQAIYGDGDSDIISGLLEDGLLIVDGVSTSTAGIGPEVAPLSMDVEHLV
ncbi:retention module-containing protein [Gallaecimonas sp. GXIMD4217]|uniref:retention module-containing protein n=1 Tax=Gallaecimonas sp. GXIMD4217 TaxID=3131927 RepID=UPI00311B2DF8